MSDEDFLPGYNRRPRPDPDDIGELSSENVNPYPDLDSLIPENCDLLDMSRDTEYRGRTSPYNFFDILDNCDYRDMTRELPDRFCDMTREIPDNYEDLYGLGVEEVQNERPVGVPDPRAQVDPISGYYWPTTHKRLTNTLSPTHPYGIDIGAVVQGEQGDPIFAPVSGVIVTAGVPAWSTSTPPIPYVVIRGDDGLNHRLGHVIVPETTQVGDRVVAGQKVAIMSDEGSPGHVHLHYDVVRARDDGTTITRYNPIHLFPGFFPTPNTPSPDLVHFK